MALVLALEPDAKQAAVLKQVVSDRLGAEFVLVDSKDAALAAIAGRVPDLILVTALLSPRDEADLTGHLRDLEGANHLQTLTIPLLATGVAPSKRKKRSLLSALTGETDAPAPPSGCLPSVFAEEIRNYLGRAEELKADAARERPRTARRRTKAGRAGAAARGRSEAPEDPASTETTSSSYWAWESSEPDNGQPPATLDSAGAGGPDRPGTEAAYSSWDNPWDVSKRPAADGVAADQADAAAPAGVVSPLIVQPPDKLLAGADAVPESASASTPAAMVYLDDHELPAAETLPAPTPIDAVDALLTRPATLTASEQLLGPDHAERGSEEVDLSRLLDGAERAGGVDGAEGGAFYEVSRDGHDMAALLGAEPSVSDAAPLESAAAPDAPVETRPHTPIEPAVRLPSAEDLAAVEQLRADLERMRADRGSVERSLAEAREAQQRAEAAVAEAAERARTEAERHAHELAERAREEAAVERRTREREERKSREEVERRAEIERLAREQAEHLAREVEARVREEAATERRLRERAEREAEEARSVEAARRSEREAAERQGRLEAERRVEEERQRRQQAEARIEAERKAREQSEKRAREQAERLAREAEERRVGEATERKAREQAERQAREAERQAREAERLARDAERQARVAAESENRLRSQRLVHEAEVRRAREAAGLRASEAAERKGREEAERWAEAERKGRQDAERLARQEAELRAEAERRAGSDQTHRKAREEAEQRAETERKARLDAEHQARREAERRAAAERRAGEDAERLAAEAARSAKEAAKAERRAREQAEKRASEDRKAREIAERRARDESARRAAAEARAKEEAERHAREQAARPARKAVVVRRGRKRHESDPPVKKRAPDDAARPTQDEWGLYDPDKCGFGALYAKLEEIEDGAPLREEAPSAGDLVATAGQTPTVSPRAPRPLSMWAWREDHVAVSPASPASPSAADDLAALVDGLAITPAVAAVRYARGARVRRVTVPPPVEPASTPKGDAPIIILSRRLLKAARQQSGSDERRTARR